MDVRTATPADSSAIERIARASFQASYALSPDDIDSLVAAYFASDALPDRLDDAAILVAETEDGVVGFAEVHSDGWLEWLHVEPTERGQGAGTALVERVREDIADGEQPFEAHVLEAASEGSTFLERFGLTASGTTELDFGDESYAQEVYTSTGVHVDANEPAVDVPETLSEDGEELRVDRDHRIPGTEAPFFEVSTDEDEAWGYFCSQCGSTDVAADGLDRLACNECGNEHRADQWDGAYL